MNNGTCEQFVVWCAQPQISGFRLGRMTAHLAEDDLWGQILWGAAQRPGPALHALGEAKIRDLGRRERMREGRKAEDDEEAKQRHLRKRMKLPYWSHMSFFFFF